MSRWNRVIHFAKRSIWDQDLRAKNGMVGSVIGGLGTTGWEFYQGKINKEGEDSFMRSVGGMLMGGIVASVWPIAIPVFIGGVAYYKLTESSGSES